MDNSRYISQFLFFKNLNYKILNSSATIIGVGGLGSWVAEILARIGVKKLIIVDPDVVEEKNLNRQNYTIKDVGKLKIDALEDRIKNIRDDIIIEKYKEINENIFNTDIFFDAVDNIETKYLLNEYSVYLDKPYIFGSVAENKGYVGLINPKNFCFYDIFKGKRDVITCNLSGLDPTILFLASSLMVKLFIDYINGKREGILYHINLSGKTIIEEIKVKNYNCPICVHKNYQIIWRYMK
ncbi:MAG: HesA/MoeB/ThiF family protein [Nanopusillaceae archaeon]